MICEPISQVRPEGVFPGFFPTFSTLTKTSAPSAFANDMWWNIVEQPETLILMTIKLMKSWLVHSVSYNSILKSLYNSVLQSLIYSKSPGYGHSSRPGVSLSIKTNSQQRFSMCAHENTATGEIWNQEGLFSLSLVLSRIQYNAYHVLHKFGLCILGYVLGYHHIIVIIRRMIIKHVLFVIRWTMLVSGV